MRGIWLKSDNCAVDIVICADVKNEEGVDETAMKLEPLSEE